MRIRNHSIAIAKVAYFAFLVYLLSLLGTNLIHITVMFFLQPLADFILNKQ
jgi:hypothetical protein